MINLQSPSTSSTQLPPPSSSSVPLQFVESSSASSSLGSIDSNSRNAGGGGRGASFGEETMTSGGGTIQQQGEAEGDNGMPGFLRFSRHPFVCVFHIAFKCLALLTYLLGTYVFGLGYGANDFVFTFVTTTVFVSLDFWTVKNISGRILVGMRWWNDIKEDGSSCWVFESTPPGRTYNATDRHVFWISLNVFPIIWIILACMQLFHPTWFVLCCIGVTLSGANTVGYWKCAKDQRRQVNQWATSTAMRAMLGRFGLGAVAS
eukprot:GHVS01063423.1.p1 GENE.GHVS01063423.1~~GHVS01063423.1.p1  ORF type:complete len:301 (+),score=36.92 GHVS01063423.1:123-905(+)